MTQPITLPSLKKRSVRSSMLHVMLALVPGTFLYAVLIDAHIVINLFIAGVIAIVCEAACLALRKRSVLRGLSDGSTLLAVWLLVLCIPPSLPTWQLGIGAIVLVTLGKHVFGGLGQNPFNPAMVAYAFLIISFPVSMTAWNLTTLSMDGQNPRSSVHVADTANNASEPWDGVSGATVLDRFRQTKRVAIAAISKDDTAGAPIIDGRAERLSVSNIQNKVSRQIVHSPWSWLALTWTLGGTYLLMMRIISWHIPLSVLISIGSAYFIANALNIGIVLPTGAALLSGGIILGAFFIATDPISSAVSRQGQLIYGCGIGLLTFIIREYSVYPEGFAFAVLLMNMCVPLIDHASTGKQGAVIKRAQKS